MEPTPEEIKKPWIALVLSLLCGGLGHLYCGRAATGLILFLVSLLVAPLALLAAFLGPSTPVLAGFVVGILLVTGFYLGAAIHAYRLAGRIRAPVPLAEYQHPGIYALFILVGVLYAPATAAYLRGHVLAAYYAPTVSMSPTLLPGDRFLVNKMIDPMRSLHRGDIVVFAAPGEPEKTFVKRIIGLPGDTVEVRGKDVLVNGIPLTKGTAPAGEAVTETNDGRSYRILLDPPAVPPTDAAAQTVPIGCCFVLGDNRDHSKDSRTFGCVPLGDVHGLVQYIYFPAASWSRFGPAS